MEKTFRILLREALSDAPPLDFGASDIEDQLIKDVPEKQKPKEPTGVNFLGQTVRSNIVAKELQKYMSDIRSILNTQLKNNINSKDAFKAAREFIRNVVFGRVKTTSPVTDISLIEGDMRSKFESFLQEYLYSLYINLLKNQKFMKSPRVKWTSTHVDMTDENYIKELVQKLASTITSKLQNLDNNSDKIPPYVLELYKEFRNTINKRKVSIAKRRKKKKKK